MSELDVYGPGDVFSLPVELDLPGPSIDAAGLVVGSVVAQNCFVGYFFHARAEDLATGARLVRPDEAVLITRCSDLPLLNGRWQVVGSLVNWRDDDWPLPAFCRKDYFGGAPVRVEYSATDLRTSAREVRIDETECARLPEDGFANGGWVEGRLGVLIAPDRVNIGEDLAEAGDAEPGEVATMDAGFYLYFPEQGNAEKAADLLRQEGFEVETRLGADDANWLVYARRTMTEDEYEAADDQMEELADSLSGEYDGSERSV